jgi:hypothetical protein
MAKRFRLEEAARLLPHVTVYLREAIEQKAAYEEAEREIQAFCQRVTVMGGMVVDRERSGGARQKRDEAAQRLRTAVQAVQNAGAQIKDLDTGLIDFPTMYRGAEVCLCWKLGEDAIEYWHSVEDGFRGRKPIDGDFLANHKGD